MGSSQHGWRQQFAYKGFEMITLSDVRKIYRTRNGEVTALDGINLHIP